MKFFSLFWKSYLVLFLTFIIALRCYVAPLVYHAGCKHTHKSFDLVKIRGNLGKISENFHKIPKNLSKSLKMWARMALKMTWRAFFLEVTFYGAFFRQVWENSGKNPSHPKNLPAPTPMCCTTTDLGIFWYGSRDFWSCIKVLYQRVKALLGLKNISG